MTLNEQIQHLIYQLRLRLGWVPPDSPDQIEELRKDPQKPAEYLERFSLAPLEAPDQVLGREKDLESLQVAYQNWKQAHRPMLLIGEPGCGMTSFLHAACPFLENPQLLSDDYRIYQRKKLLSDLCTALGVPATTSVEMLTEQVRAGDHRVVIFENIERIFLRTLGGFNLLEDLRTIVDQTSDRIFWILTINSYPLYYLDRISGICSFFDDNSRYHLRPFEAAHIDATLDQRNKGYQLIFLKSENIPAPLERALKKADSEKKQSLLRNHFFGQLHAFAGGNISRALLFWVESIQGVRGEKIFLKPFTPSSFKDFSAPANASRLGINRQGLFTLEAIFQHGSVSTEDLDGVLRNSEQRSRLTIAQLYKNNWVFPRKVRNGRQEYQINLLYQSELKKLLVDQFNRKIKVD